MAWIKLDDSFTEHRKFLQAGPLAGYLMIAGIAWSNRNLTDGFIPHAQVSRLVNFTGFAHHMWMGEICGGGEDATAEDLSAQLVELGLWEQVTNGYQIHDYLKWQSSSAEIQAKQDSTRAFRVAAGRKGGQATQANRRQANQANVKQKPSEEVRSKKEEVKPLTHSTAFSKTDLPKGFPERLHRPLLDVCDVLHRVADAKGAKAVTVAAVAKAFRTHQKKEHVRAAEDLEHWALHGNGENKKIKDVVATYRNWLGRSPNDPKQKISTAELAEFYNGATR